jgi:hypothetical protein
MTRAVNPKLTVRATEEGGEGKGREGKERERDETSARCKPRADDACDGVGREKRIEKEEVRGK